MLVSAAANRRALAAHARFGLIERFDGCADDRITQCGVWAGVGGCACWCESVCGLCTSEMTSMLNRRDPGHICVVLGRGVARVHGVCHKDKVRGVC